MQRRHLPANWSIMLSASTTSLQWCLCVCVCACVWVYAALLKASILSPWDWLRLTVIYVYVFGSPLRWGWFSLIAQSTNHRETERHSGRGEREGFSICLHIHSVPGADLPKRLVWFSILWSPIFGCPGFTEGLKFFIAVCLCDRHRTFSFTPAEALFSSDLIGGRHRPFSTCQFVCVFTNVLRSTNAFWRIAVIFNFSLVL